MLLAVSLWLLASDQEYTAMSGITLRKPTANNPYFPSGMDITGVWLSYTINHLPFI